MSIQEITMSNSQSLRDVADEITEALAAVDISVFDDRLAECAARRELIQATAAQARERLNEIVHEADEAERVGVARYDEAYAVQQAPTAFRALMGDGYVTERRSGAELVGERDQLRLALRGEQAALNGVDLAEQLVKEDARDALADACAPLADWVRDRLPLVAAELAALHAVAVVAAQGGRHRVDPALSEATAHLRSFVGGEARVPAELLGAFEGASALLALARRQVPSVVHIRHPSTEIVLSRAA